MQQHKKRKTRTIAREEPRSDSKIDLDELEKLCALDCTQEEIASFFGVSLRAVEMRREQPITYERKLKDHAGKSTGVAVHQTFKEIMDAGYARGRISIRRHQHRLLEEGNATMGVWLGKNRLGQSDKMQVTGKDGRPLMDLKTARALLHSFDDTE